MSNEEFEKLVNIALESLPEEFKKKLENVSIVTSDWPSPAQMQVLKRSGGGGLLLGLYQGIPQTKRRSYGIGGPLPDKITIFKRPLLMVSRSYDDLIRNVRNTVIHEIGHHFGLSEEDIQSATNV